MPTITFGTLQDRVEARSFPYGVPDNLTAVVGQLMTESLIYIQRYISGYQEVNADTYDSDSALTATCGTFLIPKPRGIIKRIRNELKEDACDRFEYRPVTLEEVQSTGLEVDDVVSETCRLRWGSYAVTPANIVLTPEISELEDVTVEWRGIKRSYDAADQVPDEPELLAAISAYVDMEFARKYDMDNDKFILAKNSFDNLIAELAYDSREHRSELAP